MFVSDFTKKNATTSSRRPTRKQCNSHIDWVVPHPSNSGKWRFTGSPGSPTKNVIILVVTITEKADNPTYRSPFLRHCRHPSPPWFSSSSGRAFGTTPEIWAPRVVWKAKTYRARETWQHGSWWRSLKAESFSRLKNEFCGICVSILNI